MSSRHGRHPQLQRLRGAVLLAGDTFDVVTRHVQRVHGAVAAQPFGALAALPGLGTAAQPVRWAHDQISSGVYASVRALGAAGFAGAAALLRAAERRLPASASSADAAALRVAVGAVSGLFGDQLARRRNPLAPRMQLYRDDIVFTPQQLAAGVPLRLAILVHGLCCDERSWRLYGRQGSGDYATQLAAAGYLPLHLRYNTGAPIAHNGRALARLLQRLHAQAAQAPEEIVLIGHSMGGLVIRAAYAEGHRRRAAWAAAVRQLFCLGSPHRGAPLEQAVHLGSELLSLWPLTAPWGQLLNLRSAGIRDLRSGLPAHDAGAPARLQLIGSSIGRDAHDPLGWLLGDGLVRLPSALAALPSAQVSALYARHHMQLLNDRAAYALIAQALSTASQASRFDT